MIKQLGTNGKIHHSWCVTRGVSHGSVFGPDLSMKYSSDAVVRLDNFPSKVDNDTEVDNSVLKDKDWPPK